LSLFALSKIYRIGTRIQYNYRPGTFSVADWWRTGQSFYWIKRQK